MDPDSSISLESIKWILLVLSPFLGGVIAYFFVRLVSSEPEENEPRGEDHWRNLDYLSWCEWVRMQGGLEPLFRTHLFDVQDPCFAIENGVLLYEPRVSGRHFSWVGETHFDTLRGMPVGEGWSLKDALGGVRLVDRGTLYVTSRQILLRGTRGEVSIPIQGVHDVVAACSSIILGAETSDTPYLFVNVNGQKLRDIISFLLEE